MPGARRRAPNWRRRCWSVRASKADGCSSPSAAPMPTSTRCGSPARRRASPPVRSSRASARTTAPPTWRWRCPATAARTRSASIRWRWACTTSPPPYAYRCPFGSGDADECGELAAAAVGERIDALGADRVAAVIMEPNAGTNGIVAPDTYWPALREHTARARRVADRRRGDERIRPLRRMVRLAAPRRSRPPGPDDAGQGPDRCGRAARRGRAQFRSRGADRTRDAVLGPDLLRPSAGLRGRRGGVAGLRRRRPDRALARARRATFWRSCGSCRRAIA